MPSHLLKQSQRRVAYEPAAAELLALQELRHHLTAALGKQAKVSLQDAITYSVLVASEVMDCAENYGAAMPNSEMAAQTRLGRHMAGQS